MKGIDISNYQGNVDFAKVKASGVEIVILKSTEGRTWKDSNFSTYYANAKANGLKVGVYHYLRNNSSQDEVDNFLSVVGNRKFDCKIAIDMEEDFGSVSQNSKRVREFADILIAKGYEVCIYSGEYFYRDRLDCTVKNIPVWVAHYGVSKPDMPSYAGHQYTETGRVNGISGDVDINNFTDGILVKGYNNTTNIRPSAPATGGDDWIRRLQAECNNQGFSNQKVDGYYGENTVNSCPMVKPGATGTITRLLQEKLNALTYNTNGIDAIYGPTTRNAVFNYQNNHHLSADGICGKNTWREIIKQ